MPWRLFRGSHEGMQMTRLAYALAVALLLAVVPGQVEADPEREPPSEDAKATCDWLWYSVHPPRAAFRPECLVGFP